MSEAGVLTASLEDYLEAIFHITVEKPAARPKDIAGRLKVTNASVTGALRSLSEKGLINYAPYDDVTLTPDGLEAARDVVNRHQILRDVFVNILAVDEKTADEAACKMEHCIPKVIMDRFIQFARFVEACPRGGSKWIQGFGYHCDEGGRDTCDRCMALALEEFRSCKPSMEGKSPMSITTAKLGGIPKGQRAKVLKVSAKGATGKRIVEMGVTPGSIVEVERIAPLGDPIDIRIRGYHLTLRREEADNIEVEPLA